MTHPEWSRNDLGLWIPLDLRGGIRYVPPPGYELYGETIDDGVRTALYADPSSFVHLDGGTLDLGIVREGHPRGRLRRALCRIRFHPLRRCAPYEANSFETFLESFDGVAG